MRKDRIFSRHKRSNLSSYHIGSSAGDLAKDRWIRTERESPKIEERSPNKRLSVHY